MTDVSGYGEAMAIAPGTQTFAYEQSLRRRVSKTPRSREKSHFFCGLRYVVLLLMSSSRDVY
jgi:hypothetical protein